MLLPAVLYVAGLVGLPLALAALYSVSDARIGATELRFVGFENFASVLGSPAFRRALLDSFVFTFSAQALVMVGATLLALALKDSFRGRRWIRFVILLPWVAPVSLGSIGWKWILDSIYSVLSWILVKLHLVGPFGAPMWLGEPRLAMLSVIFVHAWHTLPFATVVLLAGWTAIPKDIPEAAEVDGAGFFRRLFTIELPMMRPIMNVALLFGVVFTFTDMTVIYILTRGGPHDSTQVLPSLAFFTGILGSDLAAGAAISLFAVPLLAAAAWWMLRAAHRAEVS
jgi:multiple sugar transport system permease protein